MFAHCEYGPFGEVIRSTGPMAKTNPFRFWTKYSDDESDLSYYGYRFYKTSTGTWPNRDPLEEKGGVNLYGFANNAPVDDFDEFGLLVGTVSVLRFQPWVQNKPFDYGRGWIAKAARNNKLSNYAFGRMV
jgi:RHS repeat-associated protein